MVVRSDWLGTGPHLVPHLDAMISGMTEKQLLEKILAELENISFMLGDLNAIRNGEHDPPRGEP